MTPDSIIASIIIEQTNIKRDAEIFIKDKNTSIDVSIIFIKILSHCDNIIKLLTDKLPAPIMAEVNKQIIDNEDNGIVRNVVHHMASMPLNQKKIVEQICEVLPIGGYSVYHKSEIEKLKNKK